jgi:hypothetical protein
MIPTNGTSQNLSKDKTGHPKGFWTGIDKSLLLIVLVLRPSQECGVAEE